jgi:hypothetical protein
MDARSARIQAEESLKMTIEAEKQGKTIMVFTIVTIVFVSKPNPFLPLSLKGKIISDINLYYSYHCLSWQPSLPSISLNFGVIMEEHLDWDTSWNL